MRIASVVRETDDETLAFVSQMGVSGIALAQPRLGSNEVYGSDDFAASFWQLENERPERGPWGFLELVQLKSKVAAHGLDLEAIQNPPTASYRGCLLGLPSRDQELEILGESIRNMGRAGISILSYHWMANRVWRTSKDEKGRGGAGVGAFDEAQVKNAPLSYDAEFTEESVWSNYKYFISNLLPIAEESGVTLALHPDDPPIQSIGGVARIFRSFDSVRKAIEDVAPSKNHKVLFCTGTWAEMGVEICMSALDYFAGRDTIAFVHLRNIRGALPQFVECFIDEGDLDVVEIMKLLKKHGFNGFIVDDHVPHMLGDTPWKHRGRAFATGYLRGVAAAIDDEQ